MPTIQQLSVDIKLNDEQAKAGLNEIGAQSEETGAKMRAAGEGGKASFGGVGLAAEEGGGKLQEFLGKVTGIAAGVGAVELAAQGFDFVKDQIKEMTDAGIHANETEALTVQALKSTHDASGMTAEGVAKLADQYMRLTGVDDDTIQSAENVMLSYTHLGKTVFPQATQAALDLSARFGIDLTSAAKLVGRALDDPAKGASALSRYTGALDDKTKALIATYEKHGETAKAQGVILDLLKTKIGGSAQAMGQADGGLKIMQAEMENTKQKIGQALIPVITALTRAFEPVLAWVGDLIPNALKFLSAHADEAKIVFAIFAGVLAAAVVPALYALIAPLAGVVGDVLAAAAPFVAVGLAIAGVALLFKHAYDTSKPFHEAIDKLVTVVKKFAGDVLAGLVAMFQRVLPIVQAVAGWIGGQLMSAFNAIIPPITAFVNWLANSIKQLDASGAAARKFFAGLLSAATSAVNGVLGALSHVPGPIGDMARAGQEAMRALSEGAKAHALDMRAGVIAHAQAMREQTIAKIAAMRDDIVMEIKNTSDPVKKHALEMRLVVVDHTYRMAQDAAGNAHYMHAKVVKSADDMRSEAVKHAQDLVSGMQQHLGQLATWVQTNVVTPLVSMWAGIQQRLAPFLGALKADIQAVWNGIQIGLAILKGIWDAYWPAIQQILLGAWNAIKVIVQTALGIIGTVIGTAFNTIKNLIFLVMDLISGNWGGAWTDIKNIFAGVASGILNIVRLLVGGILGVIGSLVGGILGAIGALAGNLLGKIGNLAGALLGLFGGLKDKAIALFVLIEIQIPLKIAGMIGNVLGKMGGFIGSFLGMVGSWKDRALAAVGSLVSGILNFFGSLPGKMVAIGQNIIQGIINGIRSMAGALGGAIKSTVEGIPGIGGLVSHIPGFASGGITPGGIFTGAENGPELLLKPGLYAAPAGSRVLNAQQTRTALSGNGGSGNSAGNGAGFGSTIHIHGVDANQVFNEVRRQEMIERMRRRA